MIGTAGHTSRSCTCRDHSSTRDSRYRSGHRGGAFRGRRDERDFSDGSGHHQGHSGVEGSHESCDDPSPTSTPGDRRDSHDVGNVTRPTSSRSRRTGVRRIARRFDSAGNMALPCTTYTRNTYADSRRGGYVGPTRTLFRVGAYHYFWGGRWYNCPVARGHYPRYFYYHSNNRWRRVDRAVVSREWPQGDYFSSSHVFVVDGGRELRDPSDSAERHVVDGFVARGGVEEKYIVKTIELSGAERERVEALLEKEIIQNVLAAVDPENENRYEFDRRERTLMLTAPEEVVLRVQTMVQDRRTFEAVRGGVKGLAVDVISVVSPAFLEEDRHGADRLGESNYEEIEDYLRDLDNSYYANGKKCWYNEEIGTMTIIDEEENIYRAWDHMNGLPYIPEDYH